MQSKRKVFDSNHKGIEKANEIYLNKPKVFDYGPLQKISSFKDSHPKVMENLIHRMNWKSQLQYSGGPNKDRKPHKHERFKVKFVTFLEKYIFFRPIGTFKNYELLKK